MLSPINPVSVPQRDTRPSRPIVRPAPAAGRKAVSPVPCEADEALAAWQYSFRNGFAPNLSDAELQVIRAALIEDEPRLCQGATTVPPPMQCVLDWDCEGGCVIAYAGWQTGRRSVREVEEFFAGVCGKADAALGEAGGVRYFLNWFDQMPRDVMRLQLLQEIARELDRRAVAASDDAPLADHGLTEVPF
jgi:hypothetical protein